MFFLLGAGCASEDANKEGDETENKFQLRSKRNLDIEDALSPVAEAPGPGLVDIPGGRKASVGRSPGTRNEKKDKKRQALSRHERLGLRSVKRKPRGPAQTGGEGIAVSEKPLILAGKGFDIKGFEALPDGGRFINYTLHLQEPFPNPPPRAVPEKLDLKADVNKASRNLIFHQGGNALNDPPNPEPEKSYLPPPEQAKPLGEISETQVLLSQGEESLALLHPGKKEIDLLAGNEAINEHRFRNW